MKEFPPFFCSAEPDTKPDGHAGPSQARPNRASAGLQPGAVACLDIYKSSHSK
jgi:hypothetical protein